jgi:type IX secretion system PorP/SprF family membrane protein
MLKVRVLHIVILLIIAWASPNLLAQNNYRFSQYMCNELITNPAYAGKQDGIEASLNVRKQWVNIPGSPLSQSLIIQSPIRKTKLGVGFNYLSENIGISKRHYAKLNASYTLQIEKSNLAIGLALGTIFHNIDWNSVETIQQNDPTFNVGNETYSSPFASAGLLYYNEKWYIGFSIPELFTNKLPDKKSFAQNSNVYSKDWHYYFMGGYLFDLNKMFKLKPSMLIKLEDGSANQVDFNLNVFYKNAYMFGLGLHSNDAVVSMIAYQFNQVRVCYSYDWTYSKLRTYETGTHEISISYRFKKSENRILSPRYF